MKALPAFLLIVSLATGCCGAIESVSEFATRNPVSTPISYVIGETYWVRALLSPIGDMRSCDLYNKPYESLFDKGITIVGTLAEGTAVTLVGIRDTW